ncbi:MAG: hypothetical protein ABFD70_06350 [Syntrophaceae bacterium]
MTALPLFQLVDPGLCACGEKLAHPDEIKAGSCYYCIADAALTEHDKDSMRAEVVEANNVRSRHYRRAV